MNKDDILVSINCITYNHSKYIRDTLESFVNQITDFKYEVLIHDDASTDGTQEIIKEYQNKYPAIIKPIFQRENQYSKGAKQISYFSNDLRANGKYIAMCEGDDYWCDNYKLQKQVKCMENDDSLSMVFNGAKYYDDKKQIFTKEYRAYKNTCIAQTRDIIFNGGGFCPTASLLYKKSLIEDMPEFYTDAHVGDYPLQIILAAKGNIKYIDEIMSVYRVNTGSSWTSNLDDNKRIKTLNSDINLLEEYNRYFDYKFDEYIKEKNKENLFLISVIKSDIKEIKSKENFELYKKLRLLSKLKIYFKYYFPKVYKKIIYIKEKKK